MTKFKHSCGYIAKTSAESDAHGYNHLCNYSIIGGNIDASPEIMFAFPGTYDYIVFQTSMYADDVDSVIPDTAQYKVSVKVTARGSTLSPSLYSVKKSTDSGKTWVAVSDKSKLTFSNTLKINGVVKGDINKSGKVDIKRCNPVSESCEWSKQDLINTKHNPKGLKKFSGL